MESDVLIPRFNGACTTINIDGYAAMPVCCCWVASSWDVYVIPHGRLQASSTWYSSTRHKWQFCFTSYICLVGNTHIVIETRDCWCPIRWQCAYVCNACLGSWSHGIIQHHVSNACKNGDPLSTFFRQNSNFLCS
jgi:hypothetical protein